MEKRYFSLQELCQYAGLKRGTVYYLVFHKRIPYKKLTESKKSPLLFDKIEIDDWLKTKPGITIREIKKG